MSSASTVVHASCVAVDGHAIVIKGQSGSGKSTLALEMIALGAVLVADDRTILTRKQGGIVASCPDTIAGQIEARGLGILTLPHAPAPVRMIIDLDQDETERLPDRRSIEILGCRLISVHNPPAATRAAALCLAVRHGFAP